MSGSDYLAITTFSPRGYELYGRRFVETFLRYWSMPLLAFYESERPDISHPRLILRDLDLDAERTSFLERYDAPPFRGTIDDFTTQAIRFCHKVFAFTSPVATSQWRLWIDADVETHAPVTSDHVRRLCPHGYALSYLGRADMASETGFIACRVADARVATMLDELRRSYTSGSLFALDARERHDGALFDRVRALLPREQQWNLSQDVTGTHVWPHTVLGEVMHHWKGQAKKRTAYGAAW